MLKSIIQILLILPVQIFAINIQVRILSDRNISSFSIVPLSGKYEIHNNGNNVFNLLKGDSVQFSAKQNKIHVSSAKGEIGVFDSVHIEGKGFINYLRMYFADISKTVKCVYDDNLKLYANNGKFIIINDVDLERYVAGVVEAEGGGWKESIEYYKVQAIICRTYALENMDKHVLDGYNLCSKVHCQVYKGRCKNTNIMMAASKTAGDIIVDSSMNMISAVFHSNCGGQTVNSEDVWMKPLSYLVSVIDTFCRDQKNSTWTAEMTTKEWLNYLSVKYHFPVQDSVMLDSVMSFKQKKRKSSLCYNIPLTDIRDDLKLKSTFFSIENKGDKVIFNGRGYGHGIGLCQYGAMRMAKSGYNYKDIICFYYKGVKVVNYQSIK